ncbi:DNA polymerase IV [Alicyclobacillus cycloheptanicus]|uniref:DNA polymerase IV n=1 Tax=Alicyclobacillus cycloheptanicus TaxID=1457 RepID=A0ABT9XMY8_9BACL|nr:DNA polymerase IV [Alicyclobacillus cycloheptanicus]MDQ0191495.1 DNA polymerase-4 [Alicyclobacillus cycloheptanicus]WDM01900.1 DNA polymerase IV [Alicyclobacillus cycloheptanicus]
MTANGQECTLNRSILHIDMNAFYCSCHAAEEPELYKNRPTAVAGSPQTRHGVVVTASYEARQRGVRATMTVQEALRVCPDLIVIHPDFDLYRKYAKRVFALVRCYTPQVEIVSIDECFADVTGSRQFGTAQEIAQTLQQRILEELGLPCSIGIAPNLFLAKMASDFRKPMGLTVITLDDVPALLWPLPVQSMFGAGAKTAQRLERLGIRTIGDLARARPEPLLRSLGKRGLELRAWANGLDDRPVQAEPDAQKSIGHSITLSKDADQPNELAMVLMNLSDQVGRRVRRHGLAGRTVQLTIRYANRETIIRSRTLPVPTQLTEEIYREALALMTEHRRTDRKVRLLGVTLQNLQSAEADGVSSVAGNEDAPGTQVLLPLFADVAVPAADPEPRLTDDRRDRLRKLTEVTDRLRDRYGEDIVVRGRMLQPHESSQIRNRRVRGTSLQKDSFHKDSFQKGMNPSADFGRSD